MSSSLRILARKLAFFVATVLGASFVIFAIVQAAPGSTVDVLLPASAPPEVRDYEIRRLGLDQGLVTQFVRWLAGVAVLEFGMSTTLVQGEQVWTLVKPRMEVSGIVTLAAVAFAVPLAFAAAWAATGRHARPGTHRFLTALYYLISSGPIFMAGIWIIVLANRYTYQAIQAGTIARPDWFPLPSEGSGGFWPMALATCTLAIGNGVFTDMFRTFHDELKRLRSEDWVRVLEARGMSLNRHLARAALPALSQTIAAKAAFLLGGLVIIERVFNLAGLGSLVWDAAYRRDYPVVIAVAFVSTVAVAGAHLAHQFVLFAADPRARG